MQARWPRVLNILKRVFDVNARELRELRARVDAISALAPEAERATDDELRARTGKFKGRIERGGAA